MAKECRVEYEGRVAMPAVLYILSNGNCVAIAESGRLIPELTGPLGLTLRVFGRQLAESDCELAFLPLTAAQLMPRSAMNALVFAQTGPETK